MLRNCSTSTGAVCASRCPFFRAARSPSPSRTLHPTRQTSPLEDSARPNGSRSPEHCEPDRGETPEADDDYFDLAFRNVRGSARDEFQRIALRDFRAALERHDGMRNRTADSTSSRNGDRRGPAPDRSQRRHRQDLHHRRPRPAAAPGAAGTNDRSHSRHHFHRAGDRGIARTHPRSAAEALDALSRAGNQTTSCSPRCCRNILSTDAADRAAARTRSSISMRRRSTPFTDSASACCAEQRF